MDNVEDRIDDALKQARAAQANVEELSSKRLAELMEMPHWQAARHYNDPRLTAKHRDALLDHVAKRRPNPTWKAASSLSLGADAFGWIMRHLRLTCLATGVAAILALAWLNTPRFIDIGRLALDLEAVWPDGTVQPMSEGSIYAVIDADVDGNWEIRIWRPRKGYQPGVVAYDALFAAR